MVQYLGEHIKQKQKMLRGFKRPLDRFKINGYIKWFYTQNTKENK